MLEIDWEEHGSELDDGTGGTRAPPALAAFTNAWYSSIDIVTCGSGPDIIQYYHLILIFEHNFANIC